jgi:protease I
MKLCLVVAYKDFMDEEYFVTKEILESHDCETKTVSSKKGLARGFNGGQASVDLLVGSELPDDCVGLIFLGGPGTLKYLDNKEAYSWICSFTEKENFIIAAICIAPVVLAHAGCFSDRKMTVWSDSLNSWPIKELKESSINYIDQDVVIDGNLVTANGPLAAKNFAESILISLDNFNQ